MNRTKAMEFMEEANRYGSVLGLENIEELLNRLKNPQDRLHFVHVAGTNGKGSVCTYLSFVLSASGYRIGRYISPTVFGYMERIQVNGVWIEEEAFSAHILKIKKVVNEMVRDGFSHPTAFEIETAAAFLEFAKMKCDLVMLEVGLGGRLDATNIVKTVECSVITSVRMDHMGILGNTLEQIAKEKAGIIKKGIPVVSYEQDKTVKQVILEAAKEKDAPVIFADFSRLTAKKYSLTGTEVMYALSGENEPFLFDISILGENQTKNAATALEVIAVLRKRGFHLLDAIIREGFWKAKWPGRFSIVHKNPYVIADGAHNEDAALSLKKSEELYFKGMKKIRIVGVFRDKEYEKILAATVGEQDLVLTVTPPTERGLDSMLLAECARTYSNHVIDVKNIDLALSTALGYADKDSAILVYGSLSFLHLVYCYFNQT